MLLNHRSKCRTNFGVIQTIFKHRNGMKTRVRQLGNIVIEDLSLISEIFKNFNPIVQIILANKSCYLIGELEGPLKILQCEFD